MLITRLILLLMLSFFSVAYASDEQQAAQLKRELEFDVQRRNDFKNYRNQHQIFEKERDKGMSLFLEEQEKWEVTRDKGISEQRRLRAQEKHMYEGGPEYLQDLKQRNQYEKRQEQARQRHIDTRAQIEGVYKRKIKVTEEEELDIYNDRPRYTLRDRAKNKWVSQGSRSSGPSGGGSSPGFLPPAGIPAYDYPAPPVSDYMPTDNFDELPPPPPMIPYDNYGNPNMMDPEPPFFGEGSSEFGAPPPGYPPPPPEGGWDF